MAALCILMLSFQAKELQDPMDYLQVQVRWLVSKHLVRLMILTSIYKSLRGSYVNIFLSLNHSTVVRSSHFQTLSL